MDLKCLSQTSLFSRGRHMVVLGDSQLIISFMLKLQQPLDPWLVQLIQRTKELVEECKSQEVRVYVQYVLYK